MYHTYVKQTQRRMNMKAVYKNPKELATKLIDLVDTYSEGLLSYEEFEKIILTMIEKNGGSIYKNGFMPVKLIGVIGEDRKAIIDEVVNKTR
jgi:uncharacterized protein (TIGR04540 family)